MKLILFSEIRKETCNKFRIRNASLETAYSSKFRKKQLFLEILTLFLSF